VEPGGHRAGETNHPNLKKATKETASLVVDPPKDYIRLRGPGRPKREGGGRRTDKDEAFEEVRERGTLNRHQFCTGRDRENRKGQKKRNR